MVICLATAQSGEFYAFNPKGQCLLCEVRAEEVLKFESTKVSVAIIDAL